jgi:hypothetical protein
MTKLRLPKPVATNVVSRHLYLGSVYTKEQMRAFAEKAVKAEREECAKVCDDLSLSQNSEWEVGTLDCADAIRARGQA